MLNVYKREKSQVTPEAKKPNDFSQTLLSKIKADFFTNTLQYVKARIPGGNHMKGILS